MWAREGSGQDISNSSVESVYSYRGTNVKAMLNFGFIVVRKMFHERPVVFHSINNYSFFFGFL